MPKVSQADGGAKCKHLSAVGLQNIIRVVAYRRFLLHRSALECIIQLMKHNGNYVTRQKAENSALVRVSPLATEFAQTDSDDGLVGLWLKSRRKRSVNTQDAYFRDAERFRSFVGKSLARVTVTDAQDYANHLETALAEDGTLAFKASSRHRYLSAVSSLYAFGMQIGYLQFNPLSVIALPESKDDLASRIVPEEDLLKMIELEPDARNKILLRVFYVTGGRVSEIVGLTWKDVQPNKNGGQLTLFGKGKKTRNVVIPKSLHNDLLELRMRAGLETPVFLSRKGVKLSRVQMWRIVKAAAIRAGIAETFSPHRIRHAHVSHALDRGAPVHLVQETVGHADLRTTSRYAKAKPDQSSGDYLAVS